MYTTNTATPNIPTMYTTLRTEREHLVEIAKVLENMPYASHAHSSDSKFDERNKQFREKLRSLASLQAAP